MIQDREYPEFDYGYHPAMIELFVEKHGYDPREQEDPSSDDTWLQFRCDQITEVANEIAEVVHSYGKVMAASPFPTPAMSRKMVRQDWGNWNLDIVFPMVYHGFYTGDVSFISDCMIEDARDKNSMTTLYCGMTASNSPLMFECMDAALNNGAEGVSIFTISRLRSPEIRARFKAYADSARAARAVSTADTEAPAPKVVNTNPFENTGIMQAVHFHMMAQLSMANALELPELREADQDDVRSLFSSALRASSAEDYIERLQSAPRRNEALQAPADAIADQFLKDSEALELHPGEPELIDEYGVTKVYALTEQNSGVSFQLTFYFYGGIISGWSVKP